MFTIIGGDQNRYGPVSEDEIRQWIRDGRADARTLALREGTTDWKPLATFPEFAASFPNAPMSAAQPPPLSDQGPTLTPEELLAQDYDLDIFGCISRAWNLASKNLGPVVGVTVLVGLAMSVVSQVASLVFIPSMKFDISNLPSIQQMIQDIIRDSTTPSHYALEFLAQLIASPFQATLLGGLFYYYLKLIRGGNPELGDAFIGFKQFSELATLGLVKCILINVGSLLFIIPGIYLWVALIFSIPIVVDKKLAWQDAMKLSIKMVNKHWFVVFGLMLVAALVGIAGLAGCCIGVLFTIPVSLIALMYAYEDIFCRKAR